MFNQEQWKDIVGYEGYYQISNYGRILSCRGKILKQHINIANGYACIRLSRKGIEKHHKIHRLVATAFIETNDNTQQVNHIDSDKTNNHVSNLEWCDNATNMKHYFMFNTRVIEKRKIICNETKQIFKSANQVEKIMGVDHKSVKQCAIGTRKSAKGYTFKYV